MKVLIIGSGGREHAIACKIAENKNVNKIYCAIGNGGTQDIGENIDLKTVDEILNFAKKNKIDLTIVGSEELLVGGIVDKFKDNNLNIIGPNKHGAILEGSKVFAKDFMKKYGIKTAKYETFDDRESAKKYLDSCEFPLVIKASGLAAGKGVIIATDYDMALKTIDDIMLNKEFGDAGSQIVIEEFLDGVEASILSITDCKTILPFISAKDHKKIGENETGLNTGGMGAIAPNPYVTQEVYDEFYKNILLPTLDGIKKENMDFAGFIFFGLMITKKGVYLLEYNMRLGDPETQAILPLMENDLIEVIESAINKELKNLNLKWKDKSACCVVLASGGYPQKYNKGYEITGLNDVNTQVYMAGVNKKDDKYYTNGGRVLNVVALGDTLQNAIDNAYSGLEKIDFKDKYCRKDIGR